MRRTRGLPCMRQKDCDAVMGRRMLMLTVMTPGNLGLTARNTSSQVTVAVEGGDAVSIQLLLVCAGVGCVTL